jgi:hypothetical protein
MRQILDNTKDYESDKCSAVKGQRSSYNATRRQQRGRVRAKPKSTFDLIA